jgi:endonuclease III
MTYTATEARALDAIRAYIRQNRRCELSYAEIADLAGVGKSTAQNVVLKAEGAGDLVVRRRLGDPHVLRMPQLAKMTT